MVSVAIMGHGVVGSGVAEILLTHKQKLFSSLGEEIYIKKVLGIRSYRKDNKWYWSLRPREDTEVPII